MAGGVGGALIVTAELSNEDFSWLEGLRRQHYPRNRNRVPAHLTLIRTLPPSAERDVRRVLAIEAAGPPPRASIAGVLDMGGAVAFRVASEDLDRIRGSIVDRLHGLLTGQDSAGWLPHVTIQNKVASATAKTLARSLEGTRDGAPLRIAGLGLYRYLGGQWDKLQTYPFRGR